MEAVIFDYDGTLVRLNIDFGRMRSDVEDVFKGFGIDPAPLRGHFILEMIREAAVLIKRNGTSRAERFQREALGIVVDHEIRAAGEGKIFPGVIPMLERLRLRHIRVGVVTRNCHEAVTMVFPRIEAHCDAFLPRDRIHNVKPHPAHLLKAMEMLGMEDPNQCCMVGDHVSDVEAGKRVHMKTAGVLTGSADRSRFIEAGADYVLEDVTEIIDHIS